jgi:uncharacterized protein YbcI
MEAQMRDDQQEQGVLVAISDAVIKLYKERFGRGPTRGRAAWAGDDTLVVTLEDTLTLAERNLAKLGQHQRLRETRMLFQYASLREFCEPVELLTGRKVRAFMSGIDAAADGASIEAFLLYPESYTGPSRFERAETA